MLRKFLIFHLALSGAFPGPLTPPSSAVIWRVPGSTHSPLECCHLARFRVHSLPSSAVIWRVPGSTHSPLEGESQKPSRQATVDAVGGTPSPKDWRLSTLPRGEGDDAGHYNQIRVLKIQISNQGLEDSDIKSNGLFAALPDGIRYCARLPAVIEGRYPDRVSITFPLLIFPPCKVVESDALSSADVPGLF